MFYSKNKSIDPLCISSILIKPSYVSFQTALSYYGLIPEAVYSYTCAMCNKVEHKDIFIKNNYGRFYYKNVPKQVFKYGVVEKEINGNKFYIATPEKALCDLLCTLPSVKSIKEIKLLLFDNLRIDEEDFKELSKDKIEYLSLHYHSTNIKFLSKLRLRYK